jgi:predicted lipid-binding transport protein (Tim44 family)
MYKALALLIALVGFSFTAFDTDARRMGGGRSVGTQREAITPKQASRPPAQQQNANASPQQPAPQPSGMSRWLGPLAGLAIGAGLAALFFNNGLGGALAGILLVAALAIGVMFLVRMFRGSHAKPEPLRYAGANPYGGNVEPPVQNPAATPLGGGAAPHSVAATTGAATTQWPADFDEHEFVRHAKLNFVNLQAANDRRDITTIRDFLTPELCREIEADMRAAGDAPQKTDVVTLNAEVLDVVSEQGKYVVSVQFSGLIREAAGTEPQPFSEIWHLEKPLSGRSGWLVSGIQQV